MPQGSGYLVDGAKTHGAYVVTLVSIQVTNELCLYFQSTNEPSILAVPPTDVGPRVEYLPAAFTLGTMASTTDSSFPQTTLSLCGLPTDTLAALVRGNDGLRGYKLWAMQGYRKLMGPPNSVEDEVSNRTKVCCVIDGASITDNNITFQLANTLNYLGGTVPSRMYYRHFCSRRQDKLSSTPEATRWADNLCCYADVCDHTKKSCQEHNVYSHFMGFPNIPVKGRYYVV